MVISARASDKLISGILYLGIIVITLWGGQKIINRAIETRFYNDFLLKWEIAAKNYSVSGSKLPVFKGTNHMLYMNQLANLMQKQLISLPASNTNNPFIYQLNRIFSPKERIFLFCLADRIILYGISKTTIMYLTKMIDKSSNQNKKNFSAYKGKNQTNYTGQIKL